MAQCINSQAVFLIFITNDDKGGWSGVSRKKSKIHRTIKLRPHIAIDPKSGEVLDLKSVLRDIVSDVTTATEIVEWHVDYRLREDVDKARSAVKHFCFLRFLR